MKFCKRTHVEYIGLSGAKTTTDLISDKDILDFHGEIFYKQWLNFSKNIKKINFENLEFYYYYDYKNIAITTDMWLNSV